MFFLGLVLTLIAYYYLAKVTVKAVGKYYPYKWARYLTIAVFVLIPLWDIVPGHLYFQYLCEKDAGTKVFRVVEIDKSYFKPNGQPDEKKLGDHFKSSTKVDRHYSSIFHITKFESLLQDRNTGEVLGVDLQLSYHGGWLNANIFPVGSGTWCAGYSPYRDVWTEVIKSKS